MGWRFEGEHFSVLIDGFEIAIRKNDGNGIEKIICSSANDFEKTFNAIVEPFGLTKKENQKESLLRMVVCLGSLECTKHMVELGADFKTDNIIENAIVRGHVAVVKYLNKCGAGIRLTELNYFMERAQKNKWYELYKFLKEVFA